MSPLLLLLPVLTGDAEAEVHAFVGATLHPVDQAPIADGVLLVVDGEISSIGPAGEVAIPEGAVVHELPGKVIIPGLVDTHSHIGGGNLNDHLKPIQPGLNAADAIDPTHPSLHRARAGGITTVNVMPGSGKLMGGQTAYLKLRDSQVVDDLLLCTEPDGVLAVEEELPERRGICGGMKMANGTNPQGSGGDPASRMGAAMLQREALLRGTKRLEELEEAAAKAAAAESSKKRRKKKGGGDGKPPTAPGTTELEADALAQIVDGQRTVHFHTHRADDVVTILRLREEFGFELVLQHVSEAWKVADEIAASGASASLIVIDSPGGKEEALEIKSENGAILEELGVTVAFHTDDPITDSRLFLRSAGLAVRAGMSPEGALEALTLAPAEMMRLDDRIGSLSPGKDADFVVLSGDPLSTWTLVEQTWIEGQLVFDRADPVDLVHAIGGEEALSRPLPLPELH